MGGGQSSEQEQEQERSPVEQLYGRLFKVLVVVVCVTIGTMFSFHVSFVHSGDEEHLFID